jgi:hypothetical protein
MGSHEPRKWDEVFEEEIARVTSRRTVKGDVRGSLIGLAFSGGGIRSATFGLGVLEYLKSSGVLKQIDYLSTVSGGGYIGAWLSANCKRAAERKAAPNEAPADAIDRAAYQQASRNWLEEDADWGASIAHLRRYSNYLSPRLGFFSADTWSVAAIWVRNTLLVQLTVILAIAVVLLLPRPLFALFRVWPEVGDWRWATVVIFVVAIAGIAGNQLRLNAEEAKEQVPFLGAQRWLAGLALATLCLVTAVGVGHVYHFHPFTDCPIDWTIAAPIALLLVLTAFFLLPVAVKVLGVLWRGDAPPREINYTQGWVQGLVVLPMLVTGFLVAAVLWGQTAGMYASSGLATVDSFGGFFTTAWRYWPLPLSVAFASLWLLSLCSIRSWKNGKDLLAACLAPLPALVVLHALLCAIMLLLHGWEHQAEKGPWLAFIWAPALVLYAFALSIIILIGMMGRQSTEAVREWWSRLGAWLSIYGFAWMLIAVAAVYGPMLAALILDGGTWKGSSVVGGWLVTTVGGLLAGKSGSTGGTPKGAAEKTTTQKLLNLAATIGPYVFIAGLLIGVSTGLHLIILSFTDQTWSDIASLHAHHWAYLNGSLGMAWLWLMSAAVAGLLLLAERVDINEFSLNAFYRSRLSRCYLGAARFLWGERRPQRFTGFDKKDDLCLAELGGDEVRLPAGPLQIVNCALNLGGSSDLALHTRHSASFTLTSYSVGSSYMSKDPSGERKPQLLGYQRTATYGGGGDGQPTLAQAISVSGAAASPNMGYHTSPVVAFLLTVFNVRLGWWFPNPKERGITSPSPWFSLRYMAKELFGGADEKSKYLMISDGGHFENLAAYELIRRRCHVIIISDAECDPELTFGGLGSLMRMCEVDFGVTIRLNVDAISPDPTTNKSIARSAVGEIIYGTDKNGSPIPDGVLIYLKASMTGGEAAAVLQYQASHPAFPHESTGDQFYGEDQFESYRSLGREVAKSAFQPILGKQEFMAGGAEPNPE